MSICVANDVSRTRRRFRGRYNEVTLVTADGEETLPLQSKAAIAAAVIDRIEALLAHRSRRPVRT